MKILVIHHNKPYHLDDYLAVSLLLYKYKQHEVVRKEITTEKQIEETLSKESYDIVYIVDVGKRYEIGEKVRYYDHHQDINIPCSLVLVLRHEFPELYEKLQKIEPLRKLIEYIDVRDRFGEAKAYAQFNIYEPFPLVRFLMSILMTEPNSIVGENFVKLIESYYKVYETSRFYNINDVKVIVNLADPKEIPVSTICDVFNPDIVIQKNVREPDKISVIKNQYSSLYGRMDLEKLKDKFPVTFIHPSKFMVVIAMSIEKIDEKVVREIVETVF